MPGGEGIQPHKVPSHSGRGQIVLTPQVPVRVTERVSLQLSHFLLMLLKVKVILGAHWFGKIPKGGIGLDVVGVFLLVPFV